MNERDPATAREGVRIVQQSDSPVEQAGALLALATVLRQSGRSAEAVPIIAQALQLYDAKGDVVSAERIRALVRPVGEVGVSAAP